MKLFGLILKVLAGLIAIFVIAIGVILMTVDPNDYREEITTAVKENTGRDFAVANMSLSIFPELAINLEKASLSNAQGFSEKPFVEVEKIQVGAAILPLLSKELQVETLTLHGLSLSLEKDAEGKTNWDDLASTEDKAQEEKDQHEGKGNPLEKLSSLDFGGIDIRDGHVSWIDAQNQQQVELKNFSLTTTSITFGEFFSIYLNAETEVKQPQIKSVLALNLEAKLEQSGQYEVKNLKISNNTSGKGIPVDSAITTIVLPSFALEGSTINLPSLIIDYSIQGGSDFPLNEVQGKLQLTNLSGDIENQIFKAKSIQSQTDMSGDVIPGGKASVNLSSSAEIDVQNQTAKLPAIQINAMDMNIKATVDAQKIIDNPTASVKLDIAETNLRALLNKLEVSLPEMSDKKTLTKFALSSQIQFQQEPQSLKVDNLNLALDDSKLSGSASIKNFSKPAIGYNLALDKINVNRYLPPKTETAATTTEKPADTDAKIELPTELLRELDIDGTIKIGSLTYDNLKPSQMIVSTKAVNGNITLNPVQANIFKTVIKAQAGLNVAGNKPKYSFKTNTQNLPIGEVLIAFTGKDQITGTGSVNADITTSGERVSEFKKGLNGKISADLTDGAVKGFNLAQAIREAKAKLSGKTLKASDSEEQTDFSELNAKATIKNGVVNTEQLSAKAPFMRIDGSGTVNLPKETLKYLVKTKIVASDKGQGGEELKDLNGLTIPVKLTGSYMSPDVSLDLNSLVEQKAKAEIEKKKEKVVEDIKKKAEDKLKDSLLKGFKF